MNPQKMLKQFQKVQEKILADLKAARVTASSGGDMVTVTMNGQKDIIELKIDPECVDKDDVEMLQDLILAAINEASRRADEEAKNITGAAGQGLGLPAGLGF